MNDIYQTPQSELADVAPTAEYGSVEKGINGEYSLDIGSVLGEAWGRVSGAKWKIHLAFGLYLLAYIVLMFVLATLFSLVGLHTIPPGLEDSPAVMQLLAGGGIVETLVLMIVTVPLVAGITMLGIRRAVDAPLRASSIFDYFGKIVPLSITMVLMYVLILIGYLLLVLPGIYLTVAYLLAFPLVIDKGLSPWQALETSRKAITKRWFSAFGLLFLIALINLVGTIPLGLGLIWTVPLSLIAVGVMYRNMFGCEPATRAG